LPVAARCTYLSFPTRRSSDLRSLAGQFHEQVPSLYQPHPLLRSGLEGYSAVLLGATNHDHVNPVHFASFSKKSQPTGRVRGLGLGVVCVLGGGFGALNAGGVRLLCSSFFLGDDIDATAVISRFIGSEYPP